MLVLVSNVALLGAVVGLAASASVGGTDDLGSGGESVASPASPSEIAWTKNMGGAVIGADVKLDTGVVSGSEVCMQVKDSVSAILANGCATVPGGGLAFGTAITVSFDDSPSTTATPASIELVEVTLTQPVP
jgi:hypothetical protein